MKRNICVKKYVRLLQSNYPEVDVIVDNKASKVGTVVRLYQRRFLLNGITNEPIVSPYK